MILGLLAEKQFGRFRLFVNGENLTGVRQTRWDPVLRTTRAPDGRWTVDAWRRVRVVTSTADFASVSDLLWCLRAKADDDQRPGNGEAGTDQICDGRSLMLRDP
jgi:hypothetical protein